MKEIQEMYTRYETELEARIAANWRSINVSRMVISDAETAIERDSRILSEIRKLIVRGDYEQS